jgi:hypothetical protein
MLREATYWKVQLKVGLMISYLWEGTACMVHGLHTAASSMYFLIEKIRSEVHDCKSSKRIAKEFSIEHLCHASLKQELF